MPTFIVKMADESGHDWFFEYSTISDSVCTTAMTRDEFTTYYRDEYGRRAMRFEFVDRMKRVDDKGTSARDDESAEDTIGSIDRSGAGETWLNPKQVLALAIAWRTDPDHKIEGIDRDFMCCMCGKPIESDADRVWEGAGDDPCHAACVVDATHHDKDPG